MQSIDSQENNAFEKGLEILELLPHGGEESRRLFFVKDKKNYSDPYIYLALEKAEKYDADAVYFRFLENQTPIPQIYVYDNTVSSIDEQKISERQRRIWNSVQVPLFYVFTKTEVLIFNSYNEPKFENGEVKYNIFRKIEFAADIDKLLKFSGRNFDNGSFWEEEETSKDFALSKSAYEKLITELKGIRKRLLNANILNKNNKLAKDKQKEIVHKLLIMSIFLKYLEEKKDKNGNTVFQNNFFNKYSPKAKEFIDILNSNGNVVQLFRDLSNRFNGEIFKLTEEEEENLKKINLQEFSEFLEGRTERNRQVTLWKLYSFRDLPVELISNIYEEFIEGKEDGIVYTPPFLVNFLLDEVIPLSNNVTNINFKILDPACGSGIFLVQAYKRLIQRWRVKNNWNPPSKDVLKQLLNDNIYGSDKNEDAIRLTAFSLTLALCDELSPLVIWKELKFDNLRDRNLHSSDFFELVEKKKLPSDFDLIIGNPPFISAFTAAAKKITDGRESNSLPNLPRSYSLSFLFLEEAPKLIKENGNVCFLFPADALLYKRDSKEFKKHFFNKYNIPYVIDFTPLRRVLFSTASVSVAAVFVNKVLSNQSEILHVVIRRTLSSKNGMFFELDKYDFHNIEKNEAIEDPFIWKSHLFSVTERSSDIIKKLSKLTKLEDHIKPLIKEQVLSIKETIYPRLLIKQNLLSHPLSTLIVKKGDTISPDFQEEVYKIYTKSNKFITELEHIKSKIDSENILYKYYILNTSTRAGLGGRSLSTILREDIKNIPFTKKKIQNILSDIEKIIISDTIEYWEDFFRFGEKSKIHKAPNEKQILDFAQNYLSIINSVYSNYKAATYIVTKDHIIYPFYWGKEPKLPAEKKELDGHLNQLLVKNEYPSANLRFIRIMRLYDDNVIYLIKPKQLRYWLRSVAIRDADETFAYLVKQEYKI